MKVFTSMNAEYFACLNDTCGFQQFKNRTEILLQHTTYAGDAAQSRVAILGKDCSVTKSPKFFATNSLGTKIL